MNQQRRGPVASRLGPLKVKVANNLTFDARQKLKRKQQTQPQAGTSSKASMKVRINNNVYDARQKIQQKTKFVDARVRIQNKKAQTSNIPPGDVRNKITRKPNAQPRDMRIKINNSKAKKDLSTKSEQTAATQVTVTGKGRMLTRPGGGVQEVNGSLVKVVTQPQKQSSVRMKAPLKTPEERTNRFKPISATVKNNQAEVSSTPASSLPGGGLIRVRNEFYKPPPVQVSAPITTVTQPVYQHQEYEEPGMEYVPSYVPQILPEHFHVAPVTHYQSTVQTYPQETTSVFRKTVQNTSYAPSAQPVKMSASRLSDPSVPVQGCRVLITNLHPVVTQEDVVELFSVAGELKKARLLRQGTAEVVCASKENALSAVRKYHKRELDGMPMSVQMIGAQSIQKKVPVAARLEASPSPSPPPPPPPQRAAKPATPQPETSTDFEPLRLYKPTGSRPTGKDSNIDVSAVHKALFKTKEPGPAKPVTFTVKI